MSRLELNADFNLLAADGEGSVPTFEMTAYTGAAIRQGWSRTPIVVDLEGMSAGQTTPILYGHGKEMPLLDSVIGKGSSTNDGKQLMLSGDLIAGEPASDKLIRLAKAGVPLQASIGADALSFENVPAGTTVTVNGRDFVGPISVARRTMLREVSVVLFGADASTSAAIAAEASEVSPMSDSLNETPVDAVKASAEGTASVAVEKTIEAKKPDPVPPTASEIADLVFERMQAAKLHEVRSSRPAAPVPTEADIQAHRSTEAKVSEATLCIVAGLQNPEKHFDERTLEAADKRRSEAGLQSLLLDAARANGWKGHDRKVTHGNAKEIFAYAFGQIQATGFATHTISNVLAATYGKFLLQGFNAVENVSDQISNIRPVSDFKTVTGVRLNGGFVFEEVGPSGEIKSADATDETRTLRAKLYGRLSSVSMVDIVNDDLGALTQVPVRLGRGAAIKKNIDFWTEFQASNSSYYQAATPAGGNALSFASLSTAAIAYRKLLDTDGNLLGITPRILLVPPDQELTAAQLMTQSLLMSSSLGSTSSKVVEPTANVLAGRYRVVSSAYLTSTSTWWLMADPSDLPAMEVAYLNGMTTPVVQQADADFNQLGIQFRGYYAYGVAKAEARSTYRMATS
jgi:hypothetical protein